MNGGPSINPFHFLNVLKCTRYRIVCELLGTKRWDENRVGRNISGTEGGYEGSRMKRRHLPFSSQFVSTNVK